MTQIPDHATLIAAWSFDTTGPVSEAIIREYLRYLDEYAREVGPLAEATTFSLRRFVADRTDRWSPSTQQIVRRAFRSFFSWAHEQDIIPDNPAAKLPPIRAAEVPVRVATDDVIARMLAAAITTRDRAIIATLAGTGMRRGEVAALTVADVDIEAGTAVVRKSKNGRPRVAPIAREAREALGLWLVERAKIAPPTDHLWIVTNGKPLSPAGLKTRLQKIAQRAGVTYSSHDSRRAFAVRWSSLGGSETGLMAACGWSSPALVAKYQRMNRTELAIAEARRLLG